MFGGGGGADIGALPAENPVDPPVTRKHTASKLER